MHEIPILFLDDALPIGEMFGFGARTGQSGAWIVCSLNFGRLLLHLEVPGNAED